MCAAEQGLIKSIRKALDKGDIRRAERHAAELVELRRGTTRSVVGGDPVIARYVQATENKTRRGAVSR